MVSLEELESQEIWELPAVLVQLKDHLEIAGCRVLPALLMGAKVPLARLVIPDIPDLSEPPDQLALALEAYRDLLVRWAHLECWVRMVIQVHKVQLAPLVILV